jgi:site-specific recombinase XerD
LLCFKAYLGFDLKPMVFSLEKIKQFLGAKKAEGLDSQTLNLYLCAIKFFYRHVVGYKGLILIKFAKKKKYIPMVFSKDEINLLFAEIVNRKHKLAIMLAYGSGLRVTETIKLRVKDLDFARKVIYVRQSKGGKDRITILPDRLIPDLKDFTVCKSMNDYLFESERGGRLTSRTLQLVFKKNAMKLFPDKNFTFHSLRHSFATHLMNSGVNLRFIQEMLGHSNITTTMKYLQVSEKSISNLRSPL